jgi:hypothetical protein
MLQPSVDNSLGLAQLMELMEADTGVCCRWTKLVRADTELKLRLHFSEFQGTKAQGPEGDECT